MRSISRAGRPCLAAALLVATSAVAAPAGASAEPVHLVVGVAEGEAVPVPAGAVTDVVEVAGDVEALVVEVPAARADDAAAQLAAAPGVEYVEPEVRYQAAVTPADTYWSRQWGPQLVGAPAAWDATTGSSDTVIAVLDTGVDPGPELDGKLLPGIDLVGDDADPDDDNGHGTSVAAVAAADANDAGVAGMCWSCRVLPVKVLDADGSGSSTDIAQGIAWAAEHGADVIVMSLGGPGTSRIVEDAVARARAAGAVVVAAAGNEGVTTPTFPAAAPGVIGVAGSTEVDGRYSWSNHGAWVDVAAPGCNAAPLVGGYGYFCGTSSATPLVGGAVALALSTGASPTAVEEALVATARPVGSWMSYGRIDAAALVAAAAPVPDPGGGTTDDGGTDGVGPAVVRASGDDRIATAVALAHRAHPAGAGTVVVARADQYADALAAAPLAASLDAPVLLTSSTGLRDDVAAAVGELGATSAVLVGGTGALSAQVERDLAAAGVAEVRRIAGTSRFDTARRIAQELGGSHVYVVEGVDASPSRGWPDAVAASGLAALERRPILLTTTESLPAETRDALREIGATAATVVGGTGAVSSAVEDQLSTLVRTDRVAGATRYETSARLASAAVAAGADGSRVLLATGRSWPDALAAGAAAGTTGWVLLLVDGTDLAASPESLAWLAAHDVAEVVLVGGPSSLSGALGSAVAAG